MVRQLLTGIRRGVDIAMVMAPWILAMYLLYWLDSSGTWTTETPHRGKLSVALLASGMTLSLFAWKLHAKRWRK